MIVLVCGGREYEDARFVRSIIGNLEREDIVIHGGAPGADAHAASAARQIGIHTARVDALWGRHGKAAGPVRNAAMLRLRPDKLIAFPGGRGTENCVKQTEEAGIPVERVGSSGRGRSE